MNQLIENIAPIVVNAIAQLFNETIDAKTLNFNDTRKEFAGDITLVTFPLTRFSKQKPEQTGELIGNYLKENSHLVAGFNVVKGFLNLEIDNAFWSNVFTSVLNNNDYHTLPKTDKKIVLEYCGPNTNKPLHLGHIRNMLLGYATAELLQAAGNQVHKVNIYNDRGIAICKSMLAYQLFGNNETPESTGIKGDHFIGKFYVKFSEVLKAQKQALIESGVEEKQAEEQTELMQQAREMLRQWEAGEPEVVALWEKMNNWAYAGFEETFNKLNVDFEKHYKESAYYKRGKELAFEGLEKQAYYQKDDNSVWCNLEDKGLDHKLILRGDGTSVYLTQDMAIAEARYQDYNFDQSIYVVANEQDYHFKVLQLVLEKLGKPYAEGIFHLSYGLVNLPSGRMKSREGTVVDADDLIADMTAVAKKQTEELGKIDGLNEQEQASLFHKLAMGALKFHLLKVNPKKDTVFNPEESIDFQGYTGPFIQYIYVRIQSVLRKGQLNAPVLTGYKLHPSEKELIKTIAKYKAIINAAAKEYDVSKIADYAYNLAKLYSRFWSDVPILSAENENEVNVRLNLSNQVGIVLKHACSILGFGMPTRM